MDIALLSIAFSQSQVQQQTSISVLKSTLTQAQGNANGLLKMMDSADVQALQRSVQPHLGGTIDIKL